MNDTLSKKNLDDVAKLAGVSLSTVGRVLNERGSVSAHNRKAVINAAKTLGLKRHLPSAIHGLLRIDLLMVESDTDHFRKLTASFKQQAELHRSRVVIQRMSWNDAKPEELLTLIRNPITPRQALIVVAHDTPLVQSALQEQIAKGVSVVLLTSGVAELPDAIFVGIDNFQAGRCAGRLLSNWLGHRNGDVLLMTNSLLFRAHQERVRGFLSVLNQRSTVVVTPPRECLDLDVHTSDFVRASHATGSRIVGIYNTGGGSTGISQALRKLEIRPAWVAHEQTTEHSNLLREGLLSVLIDQDPIGQAEAAIQYILNVAGDVDTIVSTTRQLRIVLEEMLP